MSIQSEISRIRTNVANALAAIKSKGITIPAGANSDDLAELIGRIAALYNIAVSLSNCTAASSNATTIVGGGTATLKFTANSGYELPDSVTVTGATYTWDKTSGTLALSNPTGSISVSVAAVYVPAYTNLVKTAEAIDSTSAYNGGLGYKNNYRLSSGYPYESYASGYTMTGYIPFSISNKDPIYIKDAQWVSGDDNCRMYFFTDKNTLKGINISGSVTAANQNNINRMFVVETLGDNYIKLTRNTIDNIDAFEYYGGSTIKYFRISLKGSGENLIISQGDPIE